MTTSIPMSAQDASTLARAYPNGDFKNRVTFDPVAGAILVPDDMLAAVQAVDLTAARKVDILSYAQSKQSAIAQGGFTVNANASGSPLDVSVATDPVYVNYLSSAVQLAQMMIAGSIPSQNIDWVQNTGTLSLSPQQVVTMGVAVAAQVQASFTTLAQVLAAIAAGTITTTGQVDSPPSPIPAWPANS